MSDLLLELFFGHGGGSSACVAEGWGPVEPFHRWTVGPESRVLLRVENPGPDCVLVIDALPWCDAASLPSQTVMLAINGRLLTTLQFSDHRTLAFPFPVATYAANEIWLTFSHLNAFTPRPPAGLDHQGRALGLLLTRLRVFRVPPAPPEIAIRARIPGSLDDGTLQSAVTARTGLNPTALALKFESIGHNCEFGLVQRGFGAEPLALLRFVMMVTHGLIEGVVQRFENVGKPDAVRVFVSDPPESEFKVHEQLYYLWFATGRTPADTTAEALHTEQCRRLGFLQRKFAEDLAAASRIYVVTRAEIMTEPEALALFCALTMHGPNTLLWTVHGDGTRAGEVEKLRPGFLLGHLGLVDDVNYAGWDAWLSVLANAFLLGDGK